MRAKDADRSVRSRTHAKDADQDFLRIDDVYVCSEQRKNLAITDKMGGGVGSGRAVGSSRVGARRLGRIFKGLRANSNKLAGF